MRRSSRKNKGVPEVRIAEEFLCHREAKAQSHSMPRVHARKPAHARTPKHMITFSSRSHMLARTNPEGTPWKSQCRGGCIQERQMARLRHGQLRSNGNKAWSQATGASDMCACGQGPETFDHYWFDCALHDRQRHTRDTCVHAQYGHSPPFTPLRDPAAFFHSPLPTRKTLRTEAASCTFTRDTKGEAGV